MGSVKLQGIVYECPLSVLPNLFLCLALKPRPRETTRLESLLSKGLALSHIGKLKSNPPAPLSFTSWGEETYFKMKKNMRTSGKQMISYSVEMRSHWRFLRNFIATKPESES